MLPIQQHVVLTCQGKTHGKADEKHVHISFNSNHSMVLTLSKHRESVPTVLLDEEEQ